MAGYREDVFVVAFTKDWDDVPTCTTHILREMGNAMPVLWVSSIGTRKPAAASVKDWRRIWGRIRHGLRRSEHKEHNLSVLRPVLIPKAVGGGSRRLNRCLFRAYLWREIPHDFKGTVEYWCFVPNAVDLLPVATQADRRVRVIYYCADDWTKFHNLDGDWMSRKEVELLQRADVVFATSQFLVDKLSQQNGGRQAIRYMSHGVDFDRFATALNREPPLPLDLRELPRPIIGFYGNLHAWVDVALIERLAQARPHWSFVLIGEIYRDVSRLRRHTNVHLLGRREHGVLPDYCRGFTAAIIPYDLSHTRMESVNPVKAKELLAAGLPVVASAVPELMRYGQDVICCDRDEAWLDALDRQIGLSEDARRRISDRVAGERWCEKVRQIRGAIQ